ncbi:MFS general substrate transporter [Aspergillus brunneoviolaceus CBS 621.78]|uniref:MFS general substrate transporter n=1 Tax=Aspergillus brunneoviolaceus CBS 621.78 TaxID=1450534 RepID=A0ACD1GPS6_9EURO|nr:MFS general substrate transporter [Aspergillus brunneoviolaceus CBS 621.78]RAH51175.1 MFS general substrate transporter [Aspergillus brunneoviolaceus CBS 621.78]
MLPELNVAKSGAEEPVAKGAAASDPGGSIPPGSSARGVPPELSGFTGELIFILLCSMGLFLFGLFLGNVIINQAVFPHALGVSESNTPWLIGSFLLANGIAVIVSGSLADLSNPKLLMVLGFGWLVIWNIVGVFSIRPSLPVLFFVVRAMQGLAIGVLQSTSMSLLGRVYSPGIRKTRVFSVMSAMTPVGFLVGCLQGGALTVHLPWIFGSNAIASFIFAVASFYGIPSFAPKAGSSGDQLSLKHFDALGAVLAALGCGLIILGLTQGVPSGWSPYTYSLIIVGGVFLVLFYFAERRASRPLVDNRLWTTPGFLPLAISYFLGYGAYVGGWMFFAVRFLLTIQGHAPITVALFFIPNMVCGILATYIVSQTLHLVPGHWILIAGMVATTMGPVFFIPQTPNTIYWALSMPGIALVTFGPDLTFAAASIFITSNVPRSFQGSAGSLLVTIQNLSAAIVTAIGDTIGKEVTQAGGDGYSLDLGALRAIWWFSFAISLAAAGVCVGFVRIPRSEEKDHVE